MQDPLPVWIAVGGTPQSVVRAGRLGLPMALAIIGGQPARFAPFAELHRRAAAEAGHERPLAVSINSHGFIADDIAGRALDVAYPAHKVVDGPDRPRARLAADDPRPVRGRRDARRATTSSAPPTR